MTLHRDRLLVGERAERGIAGGGGRLGAAGGGFQQGWEELGRLRHHFARLPAHSTFPVCTLEEGRSHTIGIDPGGLGLHLLLALPSWAQVDGMTS